MGPRAKPSSSARAGRHKSPRPARSTRRGSPGLPASGSLGPDLGVTGFERREQGLDPLQRGPAPAEGRDPGQEDVEGGHQEEDDEDRPGQGRAVEPGQAGEDEQQQPDEAEDANWPQPADTA